MKDKNFEGITIPKDIMSSEMFSAVLHVADTEYDKALKIVNDYISRSDDVESKNIATLMSVQILVCAGYDQIALMLSKSLFKNLKTNYSKSLCQRTINNISKN